MVEHITKYDIDFKKTYTATMDIVYRYNVPQICLTHRQCSVSPEDKLNDGQGSLYDPVSKQMRCEEKDFTEFNDIFKDSYLYEIYKMIPNVGRFRIMNMSRSSCYTLHTDLTPRYHYPIKTNDDNFFIFPSSDQTLHYLKKAKLYKVDTTIRHTFVNASPSSRIHLVLDDISNAI